LSKVLNVFVLSKKDKCLYLRNYPLILERICSDKIFFMTTHYPLDSLLSAYDLNKFIDLLEELMHLLVKLLKYEPGQHEAVIELHLMLLELSRTLRSLNPEGDGK
jgi:hypothetical protein